MKALKSPLVTKSVDLPDVRQQWDYDCGPSAVNACLKLFGIRKNEAELIQLLGTTPEDGTLPSRITTFLVGLGLDATMRNGLEISDLVKATKAGSPVIVEIQDYEDDPADIYLENAGHYIVVTNVVESEPDPTLGAIKFHDPNAGPREMSVGEFLKRWQDKDDDGEHVNLGIVVSRGKVKALRSPLVCKNASTFDEAKISRDHGQFASKPGAEESKDKPSRTDSWADKLKSFPAAVVAKARAKVNEKYTALADRYGPKTAKAIVAVGIATFPLPGGMAVPATLCVVAEMVKRWKGKGKAMELSREELKKLGHEFIESLLEKPTKFLRTPLITKAQQWTRHQGEQGGTYWQNAKGDKLYQEEDPNGKPGQAQEESGGASGGFDDAKVSSYAEQMRQKFGDQAAAKIEEMKAKVGNNSGKVAA